MEDVAKIVLAVDSEPLAQDVIDFLDRSGRARVVDSVRDPDALAVVVDRERPDAVVGSPSVVRQGGLNGSAFLAVAPEESVRLLRQAVEGGARGFFLWPAERAALLAAALRLGSSNGHNPARRATVVAVYGPRGGAGTTFVATHLAAAMAAKGKDTVIVDLDPAFGDLTWALGVPSDEEPRTFGDLEPVGEEISGEHVRNVLWTHPSGLRSLLAPATVTSRADPDRYRRAVMASAEFADAVVLHVPRSIGPLLDVAAECADVLLVVLSLDVFAFRDARRALDSLGHTKRWEIVVNRMARGSIVSGDVERVFGKPACSVLPFDRRVRAAQDRGELLGLRTRLGRAVDRLATSVFGEAP